MSKSENAPEVISLRIPSRLELLGVLDCVAMQICDRMKFDTEASSQISMSVIEAGTNAIQHGHKREASKPVDVAFLIHEDRIEVTVRDLGKGFDPSSVNGDATSPAHLLDARGRGIFIMRACMDSVDFDFSSGGTLCRLVKRLPANSGQG
jgi:serine/threonine-protein kinase RsbW